MSNETNLRATVTQTDESLYAVKITVSGHTLKGDEPVASGGGNLCPAQTLFPLVDINKNRELYGQKSL
jgi:hypothetical protein